MKTVKARALVLREYEAGESDKRLLLLAKGHGRVMVRARGARKPKSKYLAASQLFTYADYVLAEGRGFMSVTQADIIESFYDLRADYDRLHAAHVLVEVCEKTLLENINCDDLLLLTRAALKRLATGDEPLLVQNVFMMRFFDVYGLRPIVGQCAECGEHISGDIFFGAQGNLCRIHTGWGGGEVCKISADAIKALKHALESDLRGAFRFTASQQVLEEIDKVTHLLWRAHFDFRLMSYN
jgi:DNA repair protein RecO (recombination protein O)